MDSGKYVFMSEYEECFPQMKEMPTGVDTLILYTNQFDYQKWNTLESSTIQSSDSKEESPIVDLKSELGLEDSLYAAQLDVLLSNEENSIQALLSGEERGISEGINYRQRDLAKILFLEDKSWDKVFDGTMLPETGMLSVISNLTNYNDTINNLKYKVNVHVNDETGIPEKDNQENSRDKVYGSNILAGVSYRSVLKRAKDQEKDNQDANPLKDYKPYIVIHNNKMLVSFSERYAITSLGTKDQKTACMRLLWVMLQQAGQSEKTTSIGATTYPILRSEFEEFQNYNSGFADFLRLEEQYYDCILVGSESGKAYQYINGLNAIDTKEGIQVKDLESYSETYQSSLTEE
jgi:hypothetical protein